MGILIDTSVVVTLEHREESIERFLATLGDEQAVISSITASELLIGVLNARPERRQSARQSFVEQVLGLIPVLPVDLDVARTHSRLWVYLSSTGGRIGSHDLLIAATALTHGYDVLTENVREFRVCRI
jgi:tRNA(fMet)-specific endonuclease VapC